MTILALVDKKNKEINKKQKYIYIYIYIKIEDKL
jgi:hypothetical protein